MTAMYSDSSKSPFKLNTFYHRHATIALSIAISLHVTAIIMYYVFVSLNPKETVSGDHYPPILCWLPPPSNNFYETPPVGIRIPSVKAAFGIPVPIPDIELENDVLPSDPTIPADGSADPFPKGEGSGTGGNESTSGNFGIMDTLPIDLTKDFFSVQKYPVTVKEISPEYPELARRLGLEGNVSVKLLISKEGRVKQAEIVSSDNEIFNDPAKKAALQWIFTPAVMNQGTVSVWEVVPFHFRLNR